MYLFTISFLFFFTSFRAVNVVNAGCWRLQTSISAPGGAFGPNKAIFPACFDNVFTFFHNFLYIWPLAGQHIAEKGPAIVEKAPGRVWEFKKIGNAGFWCLEAPETSISLVWEKPLLLEMEVVGA